MPDPDAASDDASEATSRLAAEYRRILAELTTTDPALVAAIADVDITLIRDCLALSPAERLAAMHRRARSIEAMRRGRWTDSTR